MTSGASLSGPKANPVACEKKKQCKTTGNIGDTTSSRAKAVSPTSSSYFHLADRQNICQAVFPVLYILFSCQLHPPITKKNNNHALTRLGKQLSL